MRTLVYVLTCSIGPLHVTYVNNILCGADGRARETSYHDLSLAAHRTPSALDFKSALAQSWRNRSLAFDLDRVGEPVRALIVHPLALALLASLGRVINANAMLPVVGPLADVLVSV